MEKIQFSEKELSHYLVFYLSRTLNVILKFIFTFLLKKGYTLKEISDFKPSAIVIYNYLPVARISRYGNNIRSVFGITTESTTQKGKKLYYIDLLQFNTLSESEIMSTIMHELTHVRQRRLYGCDGVISSDNDYDEYKNSIREKEADSMGSEFLNFIEEKKMHPTALNGTRALLSAFPQGMFMFSVKQKGVKLLTFKPRDLSNFKEIL